MKTEYQVLAALVLDLGLGDPPQWPHPVRWIGRFARSLEPRMRALFSSPLIAGGLTSLILYCFSFGVPWLLLRGLKGIHPLLSEWASIWIIYTTLALRSLVDHSSAVFRKLTQWDLPAARQEVSKMVGRDTLVLSRKEVVRACVESVAESMIDGITAPLFFALLFGAPGAMLYRAINTLDSLFGHRCSRYESFGKFAARIDDFANLIPARITAPLVSIPAALLNLKPIGSIRILVRDGKKHPSPNAGLAEAAIAGAMDIQLGGINFYDGDPSIKAYLGNANQALRPRHILEANRLVGMTSGICLLIYWILSRLL